jgi:hypothetical protein
MFIVYLLISLGILLGLFVMQQSVMALIILFNNISKTVSMGVADEEMNKSKIKNLIFLLSFFMLGFFMYFISMSELMRII